MSKELLDLVRACGVKLHVDSIMVRAGEDPRTYELKGNEAKEFLAGYCKETAATGADQLPAEAAPAADDPVGVCEEKPTDQPAKTVKDINRTKVSHALSTLYHKGGRHKGSMIDKTLEFLKERNWEGFHLHELAVAKELTLEQAQGTVDKVINKAKLNALKEYVNKDAVKGVHK